MRRVILADAKEDGDWMRRLYCVPVVDINAWGDLVMRRVVLALLVMGAIATVFAKSAQADERAYGQVWGKTYSNHDWNRFYHYPYVYYPHNYYGNEHFRSAEDLYYRYPQEMRIPVYNKQWHNFYPGSRRYHWGSHFITDVY